MKTAEVQPTQVPAPPATEVKKVVIKTAIRAGSSKGRYGASRFAR